MKMKIKKNFRIFLTIIFCSCSIMTEAQNPFMMKYGTVHETVPFNKIKLEHFEPAFQEGIQRQKSEIDQITNNTQKPDFENTIVALEKSGELLDRVSSVFFNLMESNTNDTMDEIANKVIPILTEHSNNISLNEKLFARIKKVHDSKPHLNAEQQMLLKNTYDGFIRSGANLDENGKKKFRELSSELSSLSLVFSQNKLKEINKYQKVITDKKLIAGLPESALEAAAETAKEKGIEGWVFTLQAPSYSPVMTYCSNRELRKELYMAYNTVSCKGDSLDNQEICKKLVNLRMQMAQLLGYQTYADYVLEDRMAQNSKNVYKLLNELLDAYKPTAVKEMEAVNELAEKTEGKDFKCMPWDWAYYSEKLKEEKFNINNELLRPYFKLDAVIDGVFGLATKLYGITFKENKDIQVYDKDVKAYEVFDKDGSYLAVLYADFFPRNGKQSGAWMSELKDQWIDKDGNSRPHITLTMNFTKPTAEKPALLTLGEVETFLHEFGHSLHGMFANTQYKSLSGTNVYRDFVELPSQIMENFATEEDFLNTFAKHYQTGENIPKEYIKRIKDAENFNVANSCLRQLSFGLLDMAYYTRTKPLTDDLKSFEKESWKKAILLPQIENTCMTTNFDHIMAGGYSAGYYGYKWAEVLDADAFSVFKKQGIFNQDVANAFRSKILSKGGTRPPMELYKDFRGQEPTIDALLERNGIKRN